jgi:predicted RNA-binding protein YlxR (DUF448 family)
MSLKNTINNQSIEIKHIPERSCVACRDKRDKKYLIRLVCDSEGVKVDNRGKMPGRGAYLCSKLGCWELGLQQKRLDHALRSKISSENRQFLLEYAKSWPKKEV